MSTGLFPQNKAKASRANLTLARLAPVERAQFHIQKRAPNAAALNPTEGGGWIKALVSSPPPPTPRRCPPGNWLLGAGGGGWLRQSFRSSTRNKCGMCRCGMMMVVLAQGLGLTCQQVGILLSTGMVHRVGSTPLDTASNAPAITEFLPQAPPYPQSTWTEAEHQRHCVYLDTEHGDTGSQPTWRGRPLLIGEG